MPTFANATPQVIADGLPYATNVVLTGNEADLFNVTGPDPIPVLYGQAVQAVVTLTPSGGPNTLNAYVVMQTDLGDGVWVDVAWIVSTERQSPTTFVLAGGVAGSNAFAQSRKAGVFPNPQANGSNQMALGGRLRFVGKANLTGFSSAAPGSLLQVTATIRYKFLGLR